ncbi:hypothetical protein [Natrononativus amylolyticus]|uniref:hypothetical protein n=1 Tax=Natrononativus amylolyticus TaxID=2963434 RepID=UPI0020CC2057|nr:hypothetical protein [Natrononativus amylolyticus]
MSSIEDPDREPVEPMPDDEEETDAPTLRRRTLLTAAAFGLGVGVGAGATAYRYRGSDLPDDPIVPAAGGIADDHVPFSVWEELRGTLRTSPDHLPGRADALVEAGDLEALFEFVRDEIVTVPTSTDGTRDVETGTRWGVRGTLRSGAGTPRDKAELLAALYRRAGYEATVMAADDGLSEAAVRDHYTRTIDRVFDPDIDEATLEDWLDRLGHDGTEEGAFTVVDDDGAESRAVADRVRDALPDPTESRRGPNAFAWEWGSRGQHTPVVELSVRGRPRYANPFADVPFGEAGGDVSEIRARDEPETVEVTLSAVTPRTIDDPLELVSGEWTVPELIGRQLLVQTPPIVAPYEQPTARLGDVDTFTPALVLQDLELSQEEALEASVVGDPFTLHGDRLSATDDGVVSRNGEPFVSPGADVDLSDVESLAVAADAADYPTIRLEVTATDGDGAHVEGLPAAAFAVTDEDEPVMATMIEAEARAHVMYVRDDSGSMGRGVDAATDDAWFDELRAVIEDHPSTPVVEYREADSDMWTHLTDAVADGPDLIVYAHDGQETDAYLETMDAILEQAPPTVLLSAYDETSPVEDETVLAQAALTGGTAVPMGETETVHEAVLEALDALTVPTYRFDYHVPDDEVGRRTVAVTVGDDHREATTTYEPTARNPIPRTLVGLYLTVSTAGGEVTRTIGGWDPVLDGDWDPFADDPATALEADTLGDAQRYALDVHGALLGGVTVSIEGDGVPFSVALDDVLGARTSVAHMDVAAVDGDREALDAALERGGVVLPYDLMLVQSPVPEAATERGVTFFRHPRIALSRQKPLLGTDRLEQAIDVLPVTHAATTAEDPADRFVTTLERTARIAVVEAAAYEVSTGAVLGETALVDVDAFDADHDHRAGYRALADRAGAPRQDHQLVPVDGSAFALWTVDAGTGTLVGVIDDATGGGRRYRDLEERLDRLSQVMSAYNLLLMAAKGGGAISAGGALALGVVALYGQQLARMYAGVTLVLMTMDARHLEYHLRMAIAGMVCGIVWEITLGVFSVFGAAAAFRVMVFQLFDNLLGTMGVSTPTSCGL